MTIHRTRGSGSCRSLSEIGCGWGWRFAELARARINGERFLIISSTCGLNSGDYMPVCLYGRIPTQLNTRPLATARLRARMLQRFNALKKMKSNLPGFSHECKSDEQD